MPGHSIMSSYTPDSVNPNQNVVLIPVKNETIAVSGADMVGADSSVMEIGKMKVLGHDRERDDREREDVVVEKSMDDYIFQFYMGSLTVVGLLLLFRFIQKT